MTNINNKFDELVDLIATLRSENGCPWDREQTHESLKRNLIEECYEVLEAIENKDTKGIVEELGDVLLQIMLHAQILSETKAVSIDDVIQGLSDKMIRRHPHVFGDIHLFRLPPQIVCGAHLLSERVPYLLIPVR